MVQKARPGVRRQGSGRNSPADRRVIPIAIDGTPTDLRTYDKKAAASRLLFHVGSRNEISTMSMLLNLGAIVSHVICVFLWPGAPLFAE